ncbi:MAG: outer membrane protein assembly factor BamD [Thermoanaerobaculia bacterium]
MSRHWTRTLLPAMVLLGGCHSAQKENPIARLSAEEAFSEGQRWMAEEKYGRAQEYFAHAFQTEPNSEVGREALLLEADALFLDGGEDNYIKAESKYRDFLNRFPTSPRGDYAQYQAARSLEERIGHPDRDQGPTRKALVAYEELQQLFPTSEWVDEAEEGLARARASLAEHEYLVGRFSLRRGFLPAAAARFETLIELYPEYPEMDKVLWGLGQAYLRQDDVENASRAFERLASEYPDSAYAEKIPEEALRP